MLRKYSSPACVHPNLMTEHVLLMSCLEAESDKILPVQRLSPPACPSQVINQFRLPELPKLASAWRPTFQSARKRTAESCLG